MMRVNIFDNGLLTKTGHHFDFCRKLGMCLQRRGHTVTVHGTTTALLEAEFAASGIAFVPLLSHFAYAPIMPDAQGSIGLEAIARSMANEMSSARPADLNLFPTLKPLEFLSFSLAPLPGANIGYVHGEPLQQGPIAGVVWAQASKNLRHAGAHFALGAIDPIVADFLRTYLHGLPIEAFPLPTEGPCRTTYSAELGTVGFFGSQREERGMELLAPLIDGLLDRGLRVVLHDTRGQFVNNHDNPRLQLINRFVEELQQEMLTCDVIVCPMQREQYFHRMSGIACNAISAGIPLILPSGTLSAARFFQLDSLRCYAEQTPEAILHTVQEMARSYPRHVTAARKAALQWRAQHGMEHFVDKIIESLN